MRKGLILSIAALVVLLGTACGAKPHPQARYIYYPGPDQAQATSADAAPADTLPAEADDPAPADYVDAQPAAVNPRPAPVPGPINMDFGAKNAIGRVEIPKVGVIQPMFEGVTLDVLANGPGHWPGTAMPGDAGNNVVAGHRVTHTHPFFDIDLLQPGDQVIFTTAAGRFVYAVTQSFVVTPDASWIANPTSEPTMTLFACHPKHQKSHRYVVVGHLIAAQRTAPPPAPAPRPAPASHAPTPPPPPPPAGHSASTPPPSDTTTTTTPRNRCGGGWICIG